MPPPQVMLLLLAAAAAVAYYLWARDGAYAPGYYYNEGLDDPPAAPAPASAPAPPVDAQAAVDFSDVLVDPADRSEAQAAEANRQQIESVNERFEGAKRRTLNDKDCLRVGHTNPKDRWRLVQTLLRRPPCGRRVRSWRTENSDTLRGDVVPNNPSSWGMMRSARANPQADLHPGALGQLSGTGRWNSTELLPENVIVDDEAGA